MLMPREYLAVTRWTDSTIILYIYVISIDILLAFQFAVTDLLGCETNSHG